LRGPAGGVIGAAALAEAEGIERALTFDMGGTSCDVALIESGRPARASGTSIAGHPIHLPLLDIETVSAGGGSVGWDDSGGALRVGPRSAGARPGPAAYGHGGTEATVTDANVALGRLEGGMRLGESIRMDGEAAAGAVHRLARRLGLDDRTCAQGVLTVANQEMVRALRRVSVERGVDPRECTLIAFGGAGPLHAADVADELGMRRVICPPAAGVLAALGLVVAGERRDYVRTVLLNAADHGSLRNEDRKLRAKATDDVPGGAVEAAGDCRYRGQTHTLTIPWNPDGDPSGLGRDFHAAHARRFGDADPSRAVEVVNLRVAVEREGPRLPLAEDDPEHRVMGPTAIPMDGATCWVADGWRAHRDAAGAIHLERDG
ncbi:MAG: hydantoinase/oxoprolinase family protein, partial [Miltoncostaeaceae bacterium]